MYSYILNGKNFYKCNSDYYFVVETDLEIKSKKSD
jgi:hypothetical protein